MDDFDTLIKESDKRGIKIVMEKLMNMQSISLGIIIENGSVRENIHNNGISHFIEHMLFRGTRNKSLKDIAEISDNIGGNLNAFTSRENTCFYVPLCHADVYKLSGAQPHRYDLRRGHWSLYHCH